MSGRLTVDGDMGLAMRLGSLPGMTPGAPFYADVADGAGGAEAYWLTAVGRRCGSGRWSGGAAGAARR